MEETPAALSTESVAEKKTETLRFPRTIVFVSSFAIMVLELVAGRLMAPYLGVSLYTWTSVIGVILAGISLGNEIGGRIADKQATRQTLAGVFFMAGFTTLLSLFFVPFMGELLSTSRLPLLASTLIFSAVTFLPASLFLGSISPFVVKFELRALERTGRTVGRIYAWGTLGSILGTFATGFFLISLLGTKTIVLGVAAVLFILGFFVIGQARLLRTRAAAMVGLMFIGGSAIPSICNVESNYYCIRVSQNGAGYILRLDHLIHSYVKPDSVNELGYSYEKIYALLTAYTGKKDFRALFLGGGGYVMPRYMERYYPDSELVVSEIDPAVTEVNFARLELSRDTPIISVNRDARIFLKLMSETERYDYVFGDTFNDFAVPYHLTTKEFNDLVAAHLSDDGFYAVNLIDDLRYGNFLGSYIRTLRLSFPFVYFMPLETDWRHNGRNTFVVVGAKRPLEPGRWAAAVPPGISELQDPESDESKAYHLVVSDAEVDELLAGRKTVILTDDFVPVDNMLAPVFNDSYD